MKFGIGRVGQITQLLRDFIKSDEQNTFQIYQQQGRLIVEESQASNAGLVPEDLGAHESEEEDSAEEGMTAAQRKEYSDIRELKAMMTE